MSKSAVREAQTHFQSLSHEEQTRKIETNIKSFQAHQEQHGKLIGQVGEIGGTIDLANLKLEEVGSHTDAMNKSIAELILDLDGAANDIGTKVDNMQQSTKTERLIGMFSPRQATAMRETRVRNADISDNLQNLLAKSNTIVSMMQKQLEVIRTQKNTVEGSLTTVLADRQGVLEEKAQVTASIDAMVPELTALQERIENQSDVAARSALQAEFAASNSIYNAAKMKEQELLSESQTLEAHGETFTIYLESLQTQETTQVVLLNKIKADTSYRSVEWSALIDSMKTAAQQKNAHGINKVGVAVDQKGRVVMAGIAIGAQSASGEMHASHETNMQQAAFVKDQRKNAQAAFDEVFGTIMKKHDEANYTAQ